MPLAHEGLGRAISHLGFFYTLYKSWKMHAGGVVSGMDRRSTASPRCLRHRRTSLNHIFLTINPAAALEALRLERRKSERAAQGQNPQPLRATRALGRSQSVPSHAATQM